MNSITVNRSFRRGGSHVIATATQVEALALGCQTLQGNAQVIHEGESGGQIGPYGNNDYTTIILDLIDPDGHALLDLKVEQEANRLKLTFRRATETSLVLAALRAALAQCNIQHEYEPKPPSPADPL